MENKLLYLMKQKDVSIKELISSFHVSNLYELTDSLMDIFNDNIEKLIQSDFFQNYHLFLYSLADKLETETDIYGYKYLLNSSLKALKKFVKPYNKGLKPKTSIYYEAYKAIKDLIANKDYSKYLVKIVEESEEYQIMWFVITKLNKPDYVYRLVELHPTFVNLKSKANRSIFVEFINYLIPSLKELDEEVIKNYKRIIVLFLESDDFRLGNKELINLLSNLEFSLINASIEEKKHLNFIINEFDSHYEYIHTDARRNAIDYINIKSPIDIIERTNDERVDLTKLFTISIDSIRDNNARNYLFDDAFSLVTKQDGTIDLYIHIPDVDYFVKKDSETDKFMRGIGSTIYAKGYKKRMLDYKIAHKCSLLQGEKRPALTFIISIDKFGKVNNFNVLKTIINVNYNFSNYIAELFLHHSNNKMIENTLKDAKKLAINLRKGRGESIKALRPSYLIMEEINILLDMAVADYFYQNNLVFPYKNYLGKRNARVAEYITTCEKFNRDNNISEDGRNILYSIFDIYNRVYYDTTPLGNSLYKGAFVGNVGNPLREYISLETDRLVKDLIVSKETNQDYWEERIERDCIEYTETSAKIRSLYSKNN